MTTLKIIVYIILYPFLILFALCFLAVLSVVALTGKLVNPIHMTVDEQIDAINNEVALELCWAESYEECDQIIEKGKKRIAALSEPSLQN